MFGDQYLIHTSKNDKDTEIISCKSWQFSRTFEDVSQFINVNINFKVKQLCKQPDRT